MNARKISSGWINAKCICSGEGNIVYIITDKIYEFYEYDEGLNSIKVIQDGDWSSSEACCYGDGYLFVIKSNFIYKINVFSKNCEIYSQDDWGNVRAMIYDNNYKRVIIIINKIWCLNPIEPSYYDITEPGWTTCKSAAIIDQNLFVVAANFWQVNLTQKENYLNLIENFGLPKSLAVLDNKLYGFSDDQFFLIEWELRRVTEITCLRNPIFTSSGPLIKNGVVVSMQFKIFHGLHESGDLVQYTIS